jgi:hypothetical protein
MTRKLFLIGVFLMTAAMFYLGSPSWACGIRSECKITCYDASGVQIGEPVTCNDVAMGTGSCSCETDYTNSGLTGCHSHCTQETGEDEYCTF